MTDNQEPTALEEDIKSVSAEILEERHPVERAIFNQFCIESKTISRKSDAQKWAYRFKDGTHLQDMDARHRKLYAKLMLQDRNGWKKHFQASDLIEAITELAQEKEEANTEALAKQLEEAAETLRGGEE